MTFAESWREEKQSAWLYARVAAAEPAAEKRAMFLELQKAAERQAQIWERKLAKLGESPPEFRVPLRALAAAQLLRFFSPRSLRPALAALKVRGLSAYLGAASAHPMPVSGEEIGGRHKTGGGNLRAAVFGVNDGLVSNASLILGVAGAASDPAYILMSGVAGLLAGALSMAAGEYVSMRSQREMFEYQIGLERDELREYPQEEAEELALIYQTRGMKLSDARRFAKNLLKDPERAMDALAREELGLNPDDLGSPWGAALFSFLAFTGGAVVPLLPFLFAPKSSAAIVVSASLAGAGLFAVGAVLSLFTGRGALRGGLRMLVIGGGAGAVSFAIGRLLGVSLA